MARRKLEHVGVMVTDIERSIAFYQQVVGMKLKNQVLLPDRKIKLAFLGFLQDGETELELIEGHEGTLPAEGKVHHFALTVDDIEEEFHRVRGLEVRNLDGEITALPNGSRYFFFSGPDDERVEFFQPA